MSWRMRISRSADDAGTEGVESAMTMLTEGDLLHQQ